MKIFLIRHPQTTWNERGLFQGSKEGRISETGKVDAKRFAFNSKGVKIDTIYCANNKRCGYLARILLRFHPTVEIKTDFRLNERSFGDLEGLPEKDFAVNTNFNPEDFIQRYKWKPEGGKSLKQVLPRVKSFLSDLAVNEKGKKIIFVITSGGIIRLILYTLRLKDLKSAMSFKAKSLEILEISRD
ncbi:MAG: histidine phosphatase family protein [bacterium]